MENEYEQDDTEPSLEDCNEAILQNPNDAEAYLNRGKSYYFNENDRDAAIKDFDRAIKINPYYAAAFRCRGNMYAGKKRI